MTVQDTLYRSPIDLLKLELGYYIDPFTLFIRIKNG